MKNGFKFVLLDRGSTVNLVVYHSLFMNLVSEGSTLLHWSLKYLISMSFHFMFSVPCTVMQLCNVNQQNALFKLMFQFSSSCLPHVLNILCSSSGRLYCTCNLIWYVQYSIHRKHTIEYSLSDDEHKMFKTCGRQEEFN
jgi:hypothetical protein